MHVCLTFFGLVNGHLDITEIVERIEYPEDIHTVIGRVRNEFADNIVGIMLVAEYVLSPEQHLQLRVFDLVLDFAEPFPWVFVQITQAGVKRCPAPAFQRIIAGLVQRFEYSFIIRIRHPRGNKGLVCVSQHGFCEIDFHSQSSFSNRPFYKYKG